jgi:hypothetical protein
MTSRISSRGSSWSKALRLASGEGIGTDQGIDDISAQTMVRPMTDKLMRMAV